MATRPDGTGRRYRIQPAITGAALAVAAGTAVHAPLQTVGIELLSLFLALTACVYLGALLAQSQPAGVALAELGAGAVVFACAVLGAVGSAAWLAGGYALHGLWDWFHDSELVPTKVAGWFPPLCGVFDFVIAGFVLVFVL